MPQGLNQTQFEDLSRLARSKASDLGLGDDLFVQGSRAKGTARVDSDIDLAIRVSPEKFNEFLNTQSKLANPNPGSNLMDTRLHAIDTGKIQRGEARLRATAKQIEKAAGVKVDFSVIKAGGKFDNVPGRGGVFDNDPQIPLFFPPK